MHQRQRRLSSADCAGRGRNCPPGSPAADLCRPPSGWRTTAYRVSLRPGSVFRFSARLAQVVQDLLADRQDLALERVLVADLTGWRRRSPAGSPAWSRSPPGRDRSGRSARRASRPWSGLPWRRPARNARWHSRVPSDRAAGSTWRRHSGRPRAGLLPVGPCPIGEQPVRHLDQAAGAVAHQRIRADRAAMVQILQDFQALGDDVVRFSALDVHHEADATRVVLIPGIVKALSHNFRHRSDFPWRKIPLARTSRAPMRAHAQVTTLPAGQVKGNNPAAMQRKALSRRAARATSGASSPVAASGHSGFAG